ncbi:MAG: DNA-3-methyladenine glycosylase 2 family protein [Chloroflexi bacterium]|nr:DNA-3-methyladenine glycosylase 2 family protein [Chloroflexota bacterium]
MTSYDIATQHLRAVDLRLAPVIDAVGVPKLTMRRDPFDALVSAIVSQQISGKAAAAIKARVAALFPTGRPDPEGLLALSTETPRSAGLSNQKLTYLRDLAGRVASGTLDLAALPSLEDEAVIAQLIQVKGIGRWTGEMYLIFHLGRPDILPVDDLGLRAAVQRLDELPELPKRDYLVPRGEPWRPYRSIATWYLWRSLGVTPPLPSG